MATKRFGFGKLIMLLALAGGAYVYHQQQNQAPQQPTYITEMVRRGKIADTVLATGSVQAMKEVKVGAQVSGEISQLPVKIGDRVKKGDLIATIDSRTQQNEQKSALALLEASKAQLSAAEVKRQEAQQTYNRRQNLNQSGAESKESLDSAKSALEQAKSALEQAKSEVRRYEIALANSQLSLSRTRVLAPIDGVVIAVAVEEGQTVNAVQNSPTLVTLAQTDTMRIKAEIAEADVNKISVGMKAYFTLLGNNKRRFETQIESIDPAPLAISNNTSSSDSAVYYYARLLHENDEGLLRMGMTANVVITIEEAEHALLIPMTAVQNTAEGESVQVVDNGIARSQIIETGLNDGVMVEVKSGLKEGDAVVVSQNRQGTPNMPRTPRMF
ncbi:MAG: efflux RND transporter periplasmic adaptor subunit [Cardiobacteriaceae bacterium]|nr:efflux RND transporter periplasmic adaptor subunit [Cardiobacteriaceae bacterium]